MQVWALHLPRVLPWQTLVPSQEPLSASRSQDHTLDPCFLGIALLGIDREQLSARGVHRFAHEFVELLHAFRAPIDVGL
jgi:hypothetical protein